jgi:hypothetical protein
MAKDTAVKLGVSQRIKHPKYGLGTVTDVWRSRRGSTNLAVKFDKGGPVGFAEKATHDIKDLKVV